MATTTSPQEVEIVGFLDPSGVEAKTKRLVCPAASERRPDAVRSDDDFEAAPAPRRGSRRSLSSSSAQGMPEPVGESRSVAPPGAKPQPQSAAPAASCSSQLPRMKRTPVSQDASTTSLASGAIGDEVAGRHDVATAECDAARLPRGAPSA